MSEYKAKPKKFREKLEFVDLIGFVIARVKVALVQKCRRPHE